MNQLFRSLVSVRSSIYRPTSGLLRLSSQTKPPNDPSEQEVKETIETNEDQYYHRVKSSFDRLQKSRENESIEERRSRLMYQSRKRGISENGLILANFSSQYLKNMNGE